MTSEEEQVGRTAVFGFGVSPLSNRQEKETGETSRGPRRLREDDLPEVEVYYTDYGTEIFEKDGYFVHQRRTPGDVILPSHLDYYRPYKSGFRKVPTSRPISRKPVSSYTKEEIEECARRQTIRIAKAALEYYNKKHHVDYELVEPLRSNFVCHSEGHWEHCNFTAKPRGTNEDLANFFFAENHKKAGAADSVITACIVLDGRETNIGCGMCKSPCMLHPTRGFLKGLYPNINNRVLRSHTRGLAGRRG